MSGKLMSPRSSVLVALVASCVAVSSPAAERKLDFSREIRPILADKCFACHGPDAKQRQAGLRLDSREEATKPLESGERAIVAGDAAASALVSRMFAADETERMPPADSKKSLTAEQKALL